LAHPFLSPRLMNKDSPKHPSLRGILSSHRDEPSVDISHIKLSLALRVKLKSATLRKVFAVSVDSHAETMNRSLEFKACAVLSELRHAGLRNLGRLGDLRRASVEAGDWWTA
jgi:hypothetical protein